MLLASVLSSFAFATNRVVQALLPNVFFEAKEEDMKRSMKQGLRLRARCLLASILVLFPVAANPADVQTVPGQGTSSVQPSKVLSLEEAVRITIENHSSIKSAQFQINAQDAVVHQQMAAYYPTINFNNFYRTSNTVSTAINSSKGFDTVGSTANVTMTLYN